MMKKLTSICLSLMIIFGGAMSARAGGALEQIDITGDVPSPIAGHVIARLVGIKWDARCIPVKYLMNNTLDPIPNPLGPAFLSVAAATAEMQDSLDEWNKIPTSFIEMHVGGTVANLGLTGFDMKNEISFRTAAGFTAIASSPSVSLIRDVTFVDGQLIDGDADPDVSSAITVCTDVDGDGDNEFPAGFYKAGTILDNDVQFNTKASNGLRFTIDDAAMDTVGRSVDLKSIAVHEFGHSFGLSHTLDNQISAADGNGSTMFPFIDTTDPASELAQRSPEMDDIAYASFYYQEGSASSGPAALQAGDVAFNKVFGLITGELRHGVLDEPIAGGSVFAVDRQTGRVVASAFSGTVQVSRSPTGGLFLIDPEFNILNGGYVIPVPKGNYAVGIEATDGTPVPGPNISLTCQIGGVFGQLNFAEEFYNNNKEGDLELRPGQEKTVYVNPGKVKSGVDIVTARNININNFGNRNFFGFTGQAPGSYYAVAIPAAQIAAINPGQDILVQGAAFDMTQNDASVSQIFAEAILATGTIDNATGIATIDLANPLRHETNFLGQDNDFAPFFFKNPHELGRKVREGIANGTIENLFIILRIPTPGPFPGVSGFPPTIGLDGGVAVNDVPIFGLSFLSTNGVTFNRVTNFNFRFSLVLSEPTN